MWGLFIKMFMADNLARIVDPIFAGPPPYQGIKVILATYAFTFQIYGDFAGYSKIARGLGKCMGFDIMVNFNLPFFATNPREFWRRWNISLSGWLRDYLYIPLGGSRGGQFRTYRNILITMLLAGLWHGANWTFIAFGAYWAMLMVFYRLLKPLFQHIPHSGNTLGRKILFIVKVAFFFQLTSIGFIIFRAESISQAFSMLSCLKTISFFPPETKKMILELISYLWVVAIISIIQFYKRDSLAMNKWPFAVTAMLHSLLFYLMFFNSWPGTKFIYFAF